MHSVCATDRRPSNRQWACGMGARRNGPLKSDRIEIGNVIYGTRVISVRFEHMRLPFVAVRRSFKSKAIPISPNGPSDI